jgi:HEAT repeat protein
MCEPRKLTQEQQHSLLRLLHSSDELVRAQAAMRLTGSDVDGSAVRPEVAAALADANADVRRAAAWVLARLPRRAAA